MKPSVRMVKLNDFRVLGPSSSDTIVRDGAPGDGRCSRWREITIA